MIVLGLVLFGVGSAVAASARSIDGMIWGHVLQGAGAVGSGMRERPSFGAPFAGCWISQCSGQ
jgi:hypothetical protein